MASSLRFVTVVLTSRTPAARLYVISYSCANGHCAARSGYFQNSRRLVTCADRASAATSVTCQYGEVTSNPWLGMLPRTFPRPILKAYLLPSAQNACSLSRSAHGARNGTPERRGRF